MKQPNVSVELANQLGLSSEEFSRIVDILGRHPTYTELGIYSVMWSEHCSYKNSIALLKTLPRSGEKLLATAGEENAGIVDIGDGLAVVFKIESHNHPSAIEPYQGAATGVGGILRDIFSMGARPIALLNSLKFGDPRRDTVKYTMKGVVKGIGDYGNSFGVPTIAGDISFEDCFDSNPLVNAMAVGIVMKDKITRAVAKGRGNSVMIVGSTTGRDGIHGATFASEELNEDSEQRRPSVQVGDPFTEKLLLEATLEAIRTGHLIGIQDMGAAGITCSTSEMSARGRSGMVINLNKVPVREHGMTSYEIMLSESQERMLLVVKSGHEDEIKRVYERWDIQSEVIGNVTDDGRLVIYHNDDKVADIPADSLVLGSGAPVYYRESREPEYLRETREYDPRTIPEPKDLHECVLSVIGSPNIASKSWVYEQYDSMVQTNTLNRTMDAGVIRIKGTSKLLSLKTDCNPRYTYLNPKRGTKIAVAESARNVVCTGAMPLAVTNCLNFGNPYKRETYWQFKEAIEGMAEACEALGTPVTGGNVSFYNDNPNGSIYPTPVIGMLGVIESEDHVIDGCFKEPGDVIILLGETRGHVGGSEYLKVCHGVVAGEIPELDLNMEKRTQVACLTMIKHGLVKSAHDISDGGLITALVESSIAGTRVIGAKIEFKSSGMRNDFFLFGEDQTRILLSANSGNVYNVLRIAEEHSVPVQIIGVVDDSEQLEVQNIMKINLVEAKEVYESNLVRIAKL